VITIYPKTREARNRARRSMVELLDGQVEWAGHRF
jgi:hypothetical protein